MTEPGRDRDELIHGRTAPVELREWDRAVGDITALAAAALPGCAGAALMLSTDGAVTTVAATSEAARLVDAVQHRRGDGPCLTAVRSGAPVSCEDYATDRRWPSVSGEAAQAGVRSSLSVPLVDGGEVVGALNLYASEPRAFDVPSQRTVAALAQQGAVTLRYLPRPSPPTTPGADLAHGAAPGASRRLAHQLAGAEEVSHQLWLQLAAASASPAADAAVRSARRCYALVQDALLLGAVDLAAALDVPDDQLPA